MMNDKNDMKHLTANPDAAFMRMESLIELALDIAREEGDGSFPSPLEQLEFADMVSSQAA